MYILGFYLLRVERDHLLYMEVDFEKETVGVIGKRLLLFCKFSDSVYLDGGFFRGQISSCAPLFVHSLFLLALMEY
jgi:hypothetical protein